MLSLWHASRFTVRSQSRSDIFTLKLTRLSVLSLRLRLSPSPLITSRKIRRWAQNWAQSRKAKNRMLCKLLVRKEGLEPSRFYPPDPKSGASANSATFAYLESITCHATDCAFSTVAGCLRFLAPFQAWEAVPQPLLCGTRQVCSQLSESSQVPGCTYRCQVVTEACPAVACIVNASAPAAPRSV